MQFPTVNIYIYIYYIIKLYFKMLTNIGILFNINHEYIICMQVVHTYSGT